MRQPPRIQTGERTRREERIDQVAELIEDIEPPVYPAGGIDEAELALLRELPLAGVIVAACHRQRLFCPVAAAKMRAILDGEIAKLLCLCLRPSLGKLFDSYASAVSI